VRLITAHRILIGAAIAFFLFYAGLQLRRAFGPGGPLALAQSAAAAAVAAALVCYLWSLRRWGQGPRS
jgi:hypothetical protein